MWSASSTKRRADLLKLAMSLGAPGFRRRRADGRIKRSTCAHSRESLVVRRNQRHLAAALTQRLHIALQTLRPAGHPCAKWRDDQHGAIPSREVRILGIAPEAAIHVNTPLDAYRRPHAGDSAARRDGLDQTYATLRVEHA